MKKSLIFFSVLALLLSSGRATAVTCLLIPLFGTVQTTLISISLLGATSWMVWSATRFLRARGERLSFRYAFREINIYALLVISLLSLDKALIPFFY